MSVAEKARRKVLMIEIPRDELAVALMKVAVGASPPLGMTAAQALAEAERVNPGLASQFRQMADAAVQFFHDSINSAGAIQ